MFNNKFKSLDSMKTNEIEFYLEGRKSNAIKSKLVYPPTRTTDKYEMAERFLIKYSCESLIYANYIDHKLRGYNTLPITTSIRKKIILEFNKSQQLANFSTVYYEDFTDRERKYYDCYLLNLKVNIKEKSALRVEDEINYYIATLKGRL